MMAALEFIGQVMLVLVLLVIAAGYAACVAFWGVLALLTIAAILACRAARGVLHVAFGTLLVIGWILGELLEHVGSAAEAVLLRAYEATRGR